MKEKSQVDWSTGQEVHVPLAPRMCEAENCLEQFTPTWYTQRRCEDCRAANQPYRKDDSPF